MTEAAHRAAIVAEARTWLMTPYHHCADIKGAGVDCGMLLVRVFVDVGLAEPFDPRPYPPDWMLHRSEERYLGFVGHRTALVDEAQPGDVAVWRFGRCYSHGAIVTRARPLTILHAYRPYRYVVEETLDANGVLCDPDREMRLYSCWSRRAADADLKAG